MNLSKLIEKWKYLGRRLDVDESTLTGIKKDNPNDSHEMCYQMLLKWKQEQCRIDMYDNLIKALEEEKLNDLVSLVKSKALKG